MHLSIITACVPLLKRFATNLQTGLLTTTIPEHHELNSNKTHAPYWRRTHESDSKASESGAITFSSASKGRKTPKEPHDESLRLRQDGIVQTTDKVDFHDLERRGW